MAIVIKPDQKFYESNRRPDFVVFKKTGENTGIVKIKRLKSKRKK